jgi:hypothetical protein
VVTWEPEAIIAQVFADPMVQALVHTAIFRHADWLALDRGTLPWQEAVKRGAHRTGLSEAEVAAAGVPPALVARSQGPWICCIASRPTGTRCSACRTCMWLYCTSGASLHVLGRLHRRCCLVSLARVQTRTGHVCVSLETYGLEGSTRCSSMTRK